MKWLRRLLFSNETKSRYHKILEDLNIESKSVINNYKNGDYGEVVYGAFKPNLKDKKEFDSYWEDTNMEIGFSTFTDKLLLVDYIWYQSDSMKILRVLDIPSYYDDLSIFHIWPNEVVPSDHFPLVVDFYFE